MKRRNLKLAKPPPVLVSRKREPDENDEAEDAESDSDPQKNGSNNLKKVSGFVATCRRYLTYAKYVILILFIPPFLNYASLQKEEKQLRPDDGELYDIGFGQKLYMSCKGQGLPTVILDAPTGMTSDVWVLIQEQVAKITKTCIYDRAGLGFSDRPFQNYSKKKTRSDDEDENYEEVNDDEDEIEKRGRERWAIFTVERMVDDLHVLLTNSSNQTEPFVLVGSELGALVSRFYAQIYEREVSDLILVDPLVEDLFQQDSGIWTQFWFGHLIPSFQGLQLAAAAGISRLAFMVGMISQPIIGENIPEEIIMRQKHLMCNPRHLSSVVDEHYFVNETFSQIRTAWRLKQFQSRISVTVITGNYYDEQLPSTLNKAWAKAQQTLISKLLPQSKHFVINGADHRMIYKMPSAVSESIMRVVKRRKQHLKSGQTTSTR